MSTRSKSFVRLMEAVGILLLLLVSSQAALSLKCYSCSSTESFDDCKTKNKEMRCVGDQQCSKQTYKIQSTTIYGRSCSQSINCNDKNYYCRSVMGMTDCEIHCCSSDLCNTGPHIVVSSILLFGCAIVVLAV